MGENILKEKTKKFALDIIKDIYSDADEILAMTVASIKTSKEKL